MLKESSASFPKEEVKRRGHRIMSWRLLLLLHRDTPYSVQREMKTQIYFFNSCSVCMVIIIMSFISTIRRWKDNNSHIVLFKR